MLDYGGDCEFVCILGEFSEYVEQAFINLGIGLINAKNCVVIMQLHAEKEHGCLSFWLLGSCLIKSKDHSI